MNNPEGLTTRLLLNDPSELKLGMHGQQQKPVHGE